MDRISRKELWDMIDQAQADINRKFPRSEFTDNVVYVAQAITKDFNMTLKRKINKMMIKRGREIAAEEVE